MPRLRAAGAEGAIADVPVVPAASDTSTAAAEVATPFATPGALPAGSVVTSADAADLAYSTYLGGSKSDPASAIAVDGAGNAFVAGGTGSTDFPTPAGAFQRTYGGSYLDAFVAKLDPSGSTLAYGTYLGGSSADIAVALALDDAGKGYIAGSTHSTDFPTTAGAFQRTGGGGYGDAFVAKLALGSATAPTYSVSGKVTDGSGNPIPGTAVSASSADGGTTDANGTYTITGLAAGSYVLRPSKIGYSFWPAWRSVRLPPDSAGQDFTATPARASGLVYDGPTLLPNSTIMVDEGDGRISMGDHVHLRLPFRNVGSQPVSNATVQVLGTADVAGSPGLSIHNGTDWNREQAIGLMPATIGPGETGTADFWIYVSNTDPTSRQSSGSMAWIQVRTETASVLNELMQPLTDGLTTVTATVYATPTLLFSTTLGLSYCTECGAYRAVLTVPSLAPVGTYRVDFVATRPGYDPDQATTFFLVSPALSLSLAAQPAALVAADTLTLTVQVSDRGQSITDAAVWAEIVSPGGVVTAPLMVEDGALYILALRPVDLAASLGGPVLPGTWTIQATADYQGSQSTAQQSVTVLVAPGSVSVDGPSAGATDAAQSFTATVGPITTTQPITYVWQATAQTPVTNTAGLTDAVSFTWSTAGTQAITVTALNAVGMVTGTYWITINPPPTPTSTPTSTPTPTSSPTSTSTSTPTPTGTSMPTASPTVTLTGTSTPTSTPVETSTPTASPTQTLTPTGATATPTMATSTPAPTVRATETVTASPTATATQRPVGTPTPLPGTPTATAQPTAVAILPEGGTLRTDNGATEIVVPAGALPTTVPSLTLTYQPQPVSAVSPPSGARPLLAFSIEPSVPNVTFQEDVLIRVHVAEDDLRGVDPAALLVYRVRSDGTYEALETSFDPTTHTLTAKVRGFSTFVVLAKHRVFLPILIRTYRPQSW